MKAAPPVARRLLGVVVLWSVGAAALAGAGSAALVVSLRLEPVRPRVGEVATLELRTFAPHVSTQTRCGFVRVPWRVAYPFRVVAVAPSGRVQPIAVRLAARGNVYRGSVRFTSAGTWTIEVTNFTRPYNPCSGARLAVRVGR